MLFPALLATPLLLVGCGDHNSGGSGTGTVPSGPAAPASPAPGSPTVASILENNRKLDDNRDSVQKMRAKIHVDNPAAQLTPIPPEVAMTVYRKRNAGGGQVMLVEFTAPTTQRDLDALISVSANGDVEGVRYNQSGNNFVSTRGVLNEDSLFGMTLQELLGGQPEKYDLKLTGEETLNQMPVYVLDGTLKPGMESKFNRLVVRISKDNFAMLEAEFYDEHNEIARRLTVEKLVQAGGRWTRERWTIDNRGRQKKIDFEVLDSKYDQNLSDTVFSRDNLKKLATAK